MIDFAQLLQEFSGNPGASPERIAAMEMSLDRRFPAEYAAFLTLHNGGEGFVGEAFLRLYPVEELASVNADYNVDECAPGFFIVGSDGGGEAFGFDTRESEWPVVMLPFIGMEWEYAVRADVSFNRFLVQLHSGELL